MISRRTTLAIGLLIVVVGGIALIVAVGYQPDPQPETGDGTLTTEGGGNPTEQAEFVVRSAYQQHPANDTYTYSIRARFYGYNDLQFEDVMMCAYSRDGELLAEKRFGDVSSPTESKLFRERLFNVTTDTGTLPKYVTVDNPRLRNSSVVRVDIREWNPERDVLVLHQESLGEIQNEFAFPRSNQTGECG